MSSELTNLEIQLCKNMKKVTSNWPSFLISD